MQKIKNFNNMIFMREKMFLKMLSKAFIDHSKELKIFKLSDWSCCLHNCTKKCTGIFPLHTMSTIIVLLGHYCLFHSVDFISHLTATKFLVTFSETFFFSWIQCYSNFNFLHSYRKCVKWVEILVAKWTVLAL